MGPYKILLAFGPNLVASEGEEWKRQRKLVAPAFSEVSLACLWSLMHTHERSRILTPTHTVHRKPYPSTVPRAPWSRAARGQKNNRLVWDETVHIMHELFDAVWGDKHTVEIDNATELTVPVRPVLRGAHERLIWLTAN